MNAQDELLRLAARYVWWKPAVQAVERPRRVIAQVMDRGDYDDVLSMIAAIGEDPLREALRHAEAGQFNQRSWAYWHYRLGLAQPEELPALPARKIS